MRHRRSEIDRTAFAEGLVGRGDDAHRIDGVVHVRGEVKILADSFFEVDLLAFAEAVMTGIGPVGTISSGLVNLPSGPNCEECTLSACAAEWELSLIHI